MAHYPTSAVGLNYITYPAGPTANPGAALTAHASAHTKGSYTELTASSGFQCNSVRIKIQLTTAGNTYWLFDLATGAGGAEAVIVPNMTAEANGGGSTDPTGAYDLPLTIAAGTRIAARCQSLNGSEAIDIRVVLVAAGGTSGPTSYVNYGAVTATSLLALVDPGATANTKGAYTEITSSTSAVAQIITPMVMCAGNGAMTSCVWLLDIATGAGGAEVVLVPDLSFSASSSSDSIDLRSYTLLTYIAASTRIACRASCQINDATDRRLFTGILAATAPAESSGGGGALVGGGLAH